MNAEPIPPLAPADISDRDLVLQFESLGDNCELGLLQRMQGAEPLGLLRFAGVPLTSLLKALAARFEGLADPANVRLLPENGEYMVKLTKYDFVYHANAKIGEVDPDALHKQQTRILAFLVDKLVADLETPTKILVFRQNEPLLAGDLVDLRLALSRYGRSTLLWVQQARPGHPPGSVDRVEDGLLVGYVRALASRQAVPDLDRSSWLAMLRRAYTIWRSAAAPRATVAPVPAPAAISMIRLQFGAGGNAQSNTGYGWSAPEDGFTWAIDERSLLTLAPLPPADDYWLEMDVVPFTAPPALPSQRLAVHVNGELVHAFDPLARGQIACAVPARLIHGHPRLEILLEHPHAASPQEVAGERDTRRLAIAFRSLSLSGTAGV